jgi:hypothetical protein
MRITINHITLTEADRARLNDGGWDSEPKFSRYADATMNGDADAAAKAFAEGEYNIIADLKVRDLNGAFHASNNINSSWLENEEVTSKSDDLEGARSTSVGDILSDPDTGKYYIVAPFGFDDITDKVDAAYRAKFAAEDYQDRCEDGYQ